MIQKNALQDLPFKNNFMFCAVMSRENVCREFLEMLLGFPIEEVQVDYEDSLIQNIQKAMNYVKSDRRLEVNYMLLQELIDQERRDAKAEGKAEGRAEAILEIISAYGPVPEDIRQRVLEERDLGVLGDYLKAAVGMRSMDELSLIHI